MNLTAEQVAAAEAAGCQFIPAPPDGLHRFAMQRKLFRFDGQEMLATCGGGLYETASTLDRLIAIGRDRLPPAASASASAPVPVALAPEPSPAVVALAPEPSPAIEAVAPEPSQIVPEVPAPEPVAAQPDAAPVETDGSEPVAAPRPRRRARAARVAPVASEADPVAEPEVAIDGTPRPGSRARKPAAASRWATAGAERRGRTDQHWSKRVR